MLIALLVVVLVLCVLGYPAWPWATNYGWRPFGGLLIVLVIVVCILALGGGTGSVGAGVTAHGCSGHW